MYISAGLILMLGDSISIPSVTLTIVDTYFLYSQLPILSRFSMLGYKSFDFRYFDHYSAKVCSEASFRYQF